MPFRTAVQIAETRHSSVGSHFTRIAGKRKDRRDETAPMEFTPELPINADRANLATILTGFVLRPLLDDLEKVDGA